MLPVSEVLTYLEERAAAAETAETGSTPPPEAPPQFAFNSGAKPTAAATSGSGATAETGASSGGGVADLLAPKTGDGGNGFICRTPPPASAVAGPPRDLEGYAWDYPDPRWPNGAKLAINLVGPPLE